jgi:hypothetical protein
VRYMRCNFAKRLVFFYVLFEGIKTILDELQSFRLVKFSFTPRECNMAAHTLAKEATRNKVEQICLEDFLLSILSIVIREQHCPQILSVGSIVFLRIDLCDIGLRSRKKKKKKTINFFI